ncbi:hypothetical protein N7495_006959 [Penicillium taxi]|uniref:uncharacterized protein n=1 Tax=Penicillium taxi TaxID=168475 RepID=UPI0025451381|nr:uncharacterized protein N7495_006959 [Penicillium taxi]KAJ5895268.1 hypothetical protein N7495_006959 [Penicillium taxi]
MRGPIVPKFETEDPVVLSSIQPSDGNTSQEDWDSEIQLVSSLAKLQQLERKIHELRQLLPDGLLAPLMPPSSANQLPPGYLDSPASLRDSLNQAARSGIASVREFQSKWRDPELKPVWTYAESRLQEAGQPLQPTGVWDNDYDVLLAELVNSQKAKEDEQQREEENTERAKSSAGDWQSVVENFTQRAIPGVRVIKGTNSLVVALSKAGLIFLVDADAEGSDWKVSSKAALGRSSKLEQAILDCLNARSRKWDLDFLLDMISSYTDIKQTPCVKCAHLTNKAAQLPTIRRVQSQSMQAAQGESRTFSFDALHSTCI